MAAPHSVVERSATGQNPGGCRGLPVDRGAGRQIAEDPIDKSHHLAKVRVAGSNPVFRSRGSGGIGNSVGQQLAEPIKYRQGVSVTPNRPRLSPAGAVNNIDCSSLDYGSPVRY
jgi:hypothetical protein